jgi:hypothetical protein
MTLAELRDKADAKLATFWGVLVTKEEAYFAKHGRYFGFNWSPSLEVVDGVDTNFVLNPPSRFFVAEDVSFPATTAPFQIQVVRHEGPQGHGFTGWVRVKLPNGDVYMRANGYGAHSEDRAWFKHTPMVISQ